MRSLYRGKFNPGLGGKIATCWPKRWSLPKWKVQSLTGADFLFGMMKISGKG